MRPIGSTCGCGRPFSRSRGFGRPLAPTASGDIVVLPSDASVLSA